MNKISAPMEHEEHDENEAPQTPDRLLKLPEVARRLTVDATTVRRWIEHGLLAGGVVSLPSLPESTRHSRRISENWLNERLERGTFAQEGQV